MLILIVLIIAIALVFKLLKKKEDKTIENLERCNNKEYIETSDEIIRKEKAIKKTRYVIAYTFLTILALFMILPFYWMIITALKTQTEIDLFKPTFFPRNPTFENFKYILNTKYQLAVSGSSTLRFNLWRLMFNTIVVGVFSTIGTLVTTVMAAFAFSRIKFPGRDLLFTVFLATMMIPGEMMVVSNYIIVVGRLHGLNHYWAMIVPFLISVYYIYLLRQNFRQIPDELYYAAKVDGTSNLKYLFKIMIPIATPTLITISILKLMGSWNAYVWPMMVTTVDEMRLISNGLMTAFSSSDGHTNQGQQMAAATAVLIPLLLVFIFLRKYIMRGVSRSGIKG